jgi:hypothetical protein
MLQVILRQAQYDPSVILSLSKGDIFHQPYPFNSFSVVSRFCNMPMNNTAPKCFYFAQFKAAPFASRELAPTYTMKSPDSQQ